MGFIESITKGVKRLTEQFPGLPAGTVGRTTNPEPNISNSTGLSQQVTNVPGLPTSDNLPPKYQGLPMQVFGTDGTLKFGGFYGEEYLPDLQGRTAVLKYDEMFRSDAKIYESTFRTINKIKNARFYIKPIDKSKEQIEKCKALEYAFFKCGKKTWSDSLNDILTMLIYGFAVFEPTFKIINSKKYGKMYVIDSFNWRSPKTIWQWFTFQGDIHSIRQISWGDDFNYVDMPGRAYVTMGGDKNNAKLVPWDELIVLSHLRFGNNYEGISPLRPMYGSYIRKDVLLKTNIVGIQNNARGVRVTSVPEDFLGTEKDRLLDKIQEAAAKSNMNSIKITDKMKFEYCKTDYDSQAVDKSLMFENAAISGTNGTEGGMLGAGNGSGVGGGKALGKSKSDDHDELIKNYALYICEKFNNVIKYLEWANFGEQDEYNELTFEGIDAKGDSEDAVKLKTLADGGFINPADPEMRTYIAEHFDLPVTAPAQPVTLPNVPHTDNNAENKQKDVDSSEKRGEKQEGAEHESLIDEIISDTKSGTVKPKKEYIKKIVDDNLKTDPNQYGEHNHAKIKLDEWTPRRELNGYEKKVQFSEINDRFNGLSTEYAAMLRNSFAKFILPKLKKDLISTLRRKENVTDVKLGKKDKVLALVKDFLITAAIVGRKQAINEVKSQTLKANNAKLSEVIDPEKLPSGLYTWIKKHADYAVNTLFDSAEKVITKQALTDEDNGLSDDQIAFNATEAGEDYVDNENNLGAEGLPIMAINAGRYYSFAEMKFEIQGFIHSSILDDATCPLCEALDGKTYKVDDPDSEEYQSPLHFSCRCIDVPITIAEDAPENWDGLDAAVEDTGNKTKLDKLKTLSEGSND